jgi:Domain of unknown function (DUF4328)
MSGERWICGSCRSLNEIRSTRCYKCHTPRALVEADPTTLIVAGAGATEASAAVTQKATAAAGAYEGSSARAGLAQCMLVATGFLALLTNIAGVELVGRLVDGDTETARRNIGAIGSLVVVLYAFAAVTLVSWAAWLSRVVGNIPKAGLGWPNVTPTAAFIENFLPGWNLLRIPSIVRDVLRRLEPTGGRGNMLLVAAWLGLAGGALLPRVAGFVAAFFASSLRQEVLLDVILGEVAMGLTLIGLVFLILLIRRVESGMRSAASRVDPALKLRAAAEPAG